MSAAADARRRFRRRRLTALAGLVAVIAGGAAGLALLLGGGEGPGLGLGSGPAPVTLLPSDAPASTSLATRRRAAPFRPSPAALAIAQRMPLTGLVAQLFLAGLDGTSPAGAAALAGPGWGGVVFTASNFAGDGAAQTLVSAARQAILATGAPAPLIAADQEGGGASALPDLPPAGEAAIGAGRDPRAARRQARSAGRALAALGFNMTLAPLVDVDSSGGPLGGRLFGSTPSLVARYGSEALAGYRSARVVAAAGHFPGTGGASADPDQMTATVGGSLAELRARDLVPFAAIAARAPVVMMSNAVYAAFDGVTPASLLAPAVRLLRSYGFGGVVMSDDLDAALLATGGGIGQAARQALDAGDDLLFLTGSAAERRRAYEAVLAAAQRSSRERRRVLGAALRVLTLKARYGLLR